MPHEMVFRTATSLVLSRDSFNDPGLMCLGESEGSVTLRSTPRTVAVIIDLGWFVASDEILIFKLSPEGGQNE
jgi:hypothetical protein